jgi:hypothetical protein
MAGTVPDGMNPYMLDARIAAVKSGNLDWPIDDPMMQMLEHLGYVKWVEVQWTLRPESEWPRAAAAVADDHVADAGGQGPGMK